MNHKLPTFAVQPSVITDYTLMIAADPSMNLWAIVIRRLRRLL